MTSSAVAPALIPAAVLTAQATFRAALQALSRPGTIQTIAGPVDAPAALMPATAALALALGDSDTPVWLDPTLAASPEVGPWLRFRTGTPLTATRAAATFALVADAAGLGTLDDFALGSDDYPDRSATLIVQVESLTGGPPLVLRGPGVKETAILAAALPHGLAGQIAATRGLFPRGLDFLFVADHAIAAIPRTTRLTPIES